jgi:hypothetical protein
MLHGETIHQRTTSVVEDEDDRSGDDRMDEMLDAIRPELETNHEDHSTPEVQKYFDMLKASEEPLHEHTTVNVLAFVTHITSIKSKFAFSNKYYKELLRLFSDVLPSNHKMPKDMYQSKNYYLLSVWCVLADNVHADLRQLSYGSIVLKSYGRYDINGFHFRSTIFEASRPLAATTNT